MADEAQYTDTVSSVPIIRGRTRLVLHLGVLVQPYRANNGKVTALTTGDVAEFLEAEYAVMGTFARIKAQNLAEDLESSLGGALESLLMGRVTDPWGRATSAIQKRFKEFISSREAERVGIPGTPTEAAKRGVNHRLKHPYASKNPRRPSFRDTGLYMNSFRAWLD